MNLIINYDTKVGRNERPINGEIRVDDVYFGYFCLL